MVKVSWEASRSRLEFECDQQLLHSRAWAPGGWFRFVLFFLGTRSGLNPNNWVPNDAGLGKRSGEICLLQGSFVELSMQRRQVPKAKAPTHSIPRHEMDRQLTLAPLAAQSMISLTELDEVVLFASMGLGKRESHDAKVPSGLVWTLDSTAVSAGASTFSR
jgi:hypothetical protein